MYCVLYEKVVHVLSSDTRPSISGSAGPATHVTLMHRERSFMKS